MYIALYKYVYSTHDLFSLSQGIRGALSLFLSLPPDPALALWLSL